MFWLELLIVMMIIYWGVRKGGPFLAMAGGIGMFIMVFILRVKPSDPPITVILIMIAVICAASMLQACGGLDFLVRIAEKILRKNPKMITVMAPLVAWLFTFMCGTGHIVYSLLPVIDEIAMQTGVRPERPIAASIVSSQFAITACPLSAATVAVLSFVAESPYASNINMFSLLCVAIPATLCGTLAAALVMLKKGKELADDPEFQRRLAAGEIEDFSKREHKEVAASKEEKTSVTIFQPVFKTGMFAVILAFGLCWLVNTFINDQSTFITDNMAAMTNQYPWIYIIAVFIVGAITTSQASTTMIMIPIGIALGLPANIMIAGWMCCNSNFFIPASGQCVAALAFDSAGTTKIGKYVLNHSYMLPGIAYSIVSVVVAMVLGAVFF